MKNPFNAMRVFFEEDLWAIDRSSLSGPRAFLVDATRLVAVVVRDLLSGPLTLWAMSLVYTTLLSLVPLLAVGFSVLKAFGVQNVLEPFLRDMLAPLGPKGIELTNRILEFVNNIEVGVLGSLGLAFLIYTVISLIQKTEEAFNAIWRVPGLRRILQRFSDYLSVVLVGPVLVVSALALTASLASTAFVQWLVGIEPFGTIVAEAGRLVPYVLVSASFTFLYMFIPNTRVKFSAALAGGIIGGVLWETVGWAFAFFIVSSTRYAAIYSSFAILILFLIWLYLSWLILLVGVEASFYFQNPQLLAIRPEAKLPNTSLLERTAVSIMFLIGLHFHHGKPPWTRNALVQRLGSGVGLTEDVLIALKKKKLIIETTDWPPAYVPARDIDTILLQDVFNAVRQHHCGVTGARGWILPIEPAENIVRKVDDAIDGTLGSESLKELVLEGLAKSRTFTAEAETQRKSL